MALSAVGHKACPERSRRVNTAFVERLNRTLRAHVPGLGRREEGLAKTKEGLLAPETGDGLLQSVLAPPVTARSVVETHTDQGQWFAQEVDTQDVCCSCRYH